MNKKVVLINDLEKISEVIDLLLAAVNDWPNSVLSLESFESEVKDFIGNETVKQNVELALTKIDFSKQSWQAESLSQLIEVFKFYDEGISLKKIIENLRNIVPPLLLACN